MARCILLILFPLFLESGLYAQDSVDTTKKTIAHDIKLDPIVQGLSFDNKYSIPAVTDFDSTHSNLYEYQPYYKYTYFPGNLGVIGQQAYSLSYFDNRTQNDNVFLAPMALDFYSYTDNTFYNSRRPYTLLKYNVGMNKESDFTVFNTQNINKDWNFGIELHFFGAVGAYNLQQASTHQFKVFSTYFGERYNFVVQYSYNRLRTQENGGLVDSVINSIRSVNFGKELTVSLSSANSVSAFTQFYLKHEFSLIKHYSEPDSLHCKFEEFPLSIGHELIYDNSSRGYTETLDAASSSFYKHTPADTVNTVDSAYSRTMSNLLFIKSGKKTKRSTLTGLAGVGIESEQYLFADYYGFEPPMFYNNTFVQGGVWKKSKQNLGYCLLGRYYLTGRKKDNASLDFVTAKDFRLIDSLRIEFDASSQIISPSYFYSLYNSNYYIWANNFANENQNTAKLKIHSVQRKLSFSIKASYLINHIGFGNNVVPVQYTNPILVYSANVEKETHIGFLSLYNNVLLQQSNSTAINLPTFSTFNTVSANFYFYDRLLKVKAGFDFYCWTRFYAPAYSPELGAFYTQHTNKYGNYPYLDAFVQLNFKKMQLFLKYSNAGYYLTSSSSFYTVDRYPSDKPTFTYGLSWYLYN